MAKSANKKKQPKRKTKANATRKRVQRPYPQRTLEEALKIPIAIREQNNGNPWDTELVSQAALGVAKSNNKMFYAAAASRDYGLTIGSRDTEKIELSDLGRRITFAGDEAEKRKGKIDAFFLVDIFKRVYEHYGGSKLPKDEFLNNTLQSEFNLSIGLHKEFTRIFKANCEFLEITEGLDEGTLVRKTDKIEHPKDVRVVGQPKGKFDRTAFVIMPFSEKGDQPRPDGFFNEVLTNVITPAANAVGFAVETAEQSGSDVIQSTIVHQLIDAQLVIADLSDHNPNVLFELGIRITKELPVALIRAKGTGRIFDVDNLMRVQEYDPNLWPTTVENDIPKIQEHIKSTWDNRDTMLTYMQILSGQSKQTSKA